MKNIAIAVFFGCLFASAYSQCSSYTNCNTCANQVCIQCLANYFWDGAGCVPAANCPAGSTPTNGLCQCPNNQVVFSSACVASCPPGLFASNGRCPACQSPCKTCSNSALSCDSCIDGYILNQLTKTCVGSPTCQVGQYLTSTGSCAFICQAGNYFLNSACFVTSCPDGYTTNDANRTCTRYQTPNTCTPPLRRQGNTCISACSAGYYASQTSNTCEPCPANCQACTNSFICTTCNAGFTLNNGLCSGTACTTAGQVKYNGVCLTSCPPGTFNNQGFCSRMCSTGLYYWNSGCYQVCPTSLNTPDACVVVCPAGFTKSGNTCILTTNTCPTGQFLNPQTGLCQYCQTPCATCQNSATSCNSCSAGYILNGNTCTQGSTCPAGQYPVNGGGCQICPVKCATCYNSTTCITCAAGYTLQNSDCISNNSVTLQVISVVKQLGANPIVLVQILPSVLPAYIPPSVMNDILIAVFTVPLPNSQVRVWI